MLWKNPKKLQSITKGKIRIIPILITENGKKKKKLRRVSTVQ